MVICSKPSMIFQTWKVFSKSMHELNEMPKGSCNWPQSTNLNCFSSHFIHTGVLTRCICSDFEKGFAIILLVYMFSFWPSCKLCKLKYQMNRNIRRNINQVNDFKYMPYFWNYIYVVAKLNIFITDWYFHLFELITCFYRTYNVLHPVRKLNRLSEDKKRCFVGLVLFL